MRFLIELDSLILMDTDTRRLALAFLESEVLPEVPGDDEATFVGLIDNQFLLTTDSGFEYADYIQIEVNEATIDRFLLSVVVLGEDFVNEDCRYGIDLEMMDRLEGINVFVKEYPMDPYKPVTRWEKYD